MILYLKDLNNFTIKFLDLINIFSKVAEHKINVKKSVALLYSNHKLTKKEVKKIITFTIASKNKTPRNKPKQRMKDLFNEKFKT